jgi:hypothetical protein
MAYADPPYPGLARRYYGSETTFGGEVDHVELLERLSGYDGWALSTAEFALRDLLPLCPEGVRVCPWVKPIHPSPRTYGMHGAWEALVVVPGRRLRPGTRNWLHAAPARLGGSGLAGRKPIAFVAWLFDLLGLLPGDELVDLFPGSGVVSSAWREVGRVALPRGATRRGAAHADASDVAEVPGATCRADVAGDGTASRRAAAARDVARRSSATRRAPAPADGSRIGRRPRVPLGPACDRPGE